MQEQYKFVYDTLEEFVVCGTSWFPVSELSQRLKQKSIKNPITKMNEYQREYQQICKQTPRFTIGDCAGGHRADNREKNRDVLVVPRKFPSIERMNVSLIKKKKEKKNSNRSKKNRSVCKYLLIMNMRIMEKGGRIFFVSKFLSIFFFFRDVYTKY